MRMRQVRCFKTAAILFVMLVTGAATHAALPTPLVEILFEQSLTNNGSIGGTATFVTVNGSTPAYSATGKGIGGGTAMDNTAVSGMGSFGGYTRLNDDDRLDGLKSITVALWYKTSDSFGATSARLIGKRTASEGFELYTATTNSFIWYETTDVGPSVAESLRVPAYAAKDRWVFLAMTRDLASQQEKFYVGTEKGDFLFVSAHTPAVSSMFVSNASFLAIGAASALNPGAAAFDGMIDNVRIWGSKDDSSGMLTESQLYECYLADDVVTNAAATPLVEMLFDSTLTNSGLIGGTGVFVTNSGVAPTFTADGEGVSGISGDYAMDNTSVPSMGSPGGYVRLADSHFLDGFKSFSMAFWYKTSTNLGYGGRVLSKRTSATGGFECNAAGDQAWQAFGGGVTNYATPPSANNSQYAFLGEWVFAAITWNVSGQQISFYAGRKGGQLTLVSQSSTANLSSLALTNAVDLTIGTASAFSLGNGAFDGLIDNVRIWGSQSDGSGALSQTDLAAWFKADQRRPRGTLMIIR